MADDSFNDRFKIENRDIELPINFNVTPGTVMPVITRNSPNRVQLMKWGLVPSWAKDVKIGFKMINARAETITEKPAFRKAFREQRCLVPATGFYEWKKEGKEKRPYLLRDTGSTYIAFAGLYESRKDEKGDELLTYTILTTQADETVKGVHDRMPVILNRDEEILWLDQNATAEELKKLLDPYESKTFEKYEVSEKVNSPANNDASLLEKL